MNLSPLLKQRFFDANGLPLAGGLLYSYAAGTTTPQVTYSNSTGTTNTNPVVLDSSGYADVWLDPTLAYKFVLEDSSNNVQFTVDNVNYLYGLTTWSANTTYSQGAIVEDSSGYGLLYVSLVNNNQNNALTDVSAWRIFDGNVRSISTSSSALVTDNLIRSNSTSGNITVTLPACSTTPVGKKIVIKDVGSGGNSTTISGNGSDTIDGNNTYSTSLTQYASAAFTNNGTSWDVSGVIPNNVALPGKNVTVSGNLIATTVEASPLVVIRGTVKSDGTVVVGTGFTPSTSGTGLYLLTWSTAFAFPPTVVVCAYHDSAANVAVVTGESTTTANINTFTSGTLANCWFSFVAIGPRA